MRLRRALINPVVPGWLDGGGGGKLRPENAVAYWDPANAVNYATSKINLAWPGIETLTDGVAYPNWALRSGWIYPDDSGTRILNSTITTLAKTWTVLAHIQIVGTAGPGKYPRIFSACNSTFFAITQGAGTGQRAFQNGTATLYPGASLTNGFYTMGIAGSTAILNGVSDGTIDTSGALGSGAFTVGNRASDLARQFYGNILQLAVYNITPTPAQYKHICDWLMTQ